MGGKNGRHVHHSGYQLQQLRRVGSGEAVRQGPRPPDSTWSEGTAQVPRCGVGQPCDQMGYCQMGWLDRGGLWSEATARIAETLGDAL